MKDAPLFSDLAEGPDEGQAWYLDTADGVQIRVGVWAREAPKGTVLLLPGRTEYIEKYGCTATDLARNGYATMTIDFRGQGLADRLLPDRMSGHVDEFSDYQLDVAAMTTAAQKLNLPKPWFLLAHSMGGAIAFRALHEGLAVQACAFSAPLWGILMAEAMRPVAWSLSWGGRHLGLGHLYTPGTRPASYVLTEPFATNKLTTDLEMYEFMQKHMTAQPELALGGPSLRWLHEALKECRAMARLPSPSLPCFTFMGSEEDIVNPDAIYSRMTAWPGGELEVVDGKRHEILMDDAVTRAGIIDKVATLFDRSSGGESGQFTHPAQPLAAAGQGQ